MDRVRSISARLDKGYIVSKIEEEESKNELAADLSASLKAMIPGLAPVDASASVGGGLKTGRVSSERTGQNKALHHYYYTLLERWLENFKGDWFHDFADITEDIEGSWSDRAAPSKAKSKISEGDIVRVKRRH